MADSEQPARETRRDPPTGGPPAGPPPPRRSPDTAPAAETRRDTPSGTGGTGHAGAPGAATGPLIRPPGTLAERFTVIGELPAHGAESDLLHVRDAAGTEYVIKVFRAGFTADRTVWRELPGIDSPYIVRIHETGHADGRDYEVMEYVPGGNLRALTPPGRPALPAATVTEIVAQLTAGLGRLHGAGIVHRDLKPENVLVRAAAPVRLAITDFGLSKVIDQSVVWASSSRTLAYAAPESLSGQVSPARDWWSLGLIAHELLTGRPPFGGMSETAVMDHLATRPIDVGDIADPRLRLLCRGLLVRDPRRRWGAAEIERWFAGDSPPVPEDPPARTSAPPGHATAGGGLPFGGRQHTDRAELARALVTDWAEAARYFFGAMHTASGPSEAWRTLRDWLGRFDDDAEARIELIDTHLAGDAPPDVKLLHLVRWLDPGLPPHYLGHRVLPEDLPGLAAVIRDRRHPGHATAARIGRHLWDHRLLPVLAGFSGGYELPDIAERWQGLILTWNAHAERTRHELARTGVRLPDAGAPGQDEPPVILLTLLALAARPTETSDQIAAATAGARESVPGGVEWFDRLAGQAGGDPVRQLAVVIAAPDAAAAGHAAQRDRHAAERRVAERRQRWEERERQRVAGRPAAITRAVLWSLPVLLLWSGGSWLAFQVIEALSTERTAGGRDLAPLLLPALVLAVVAWLVQTAGELYLASRQGGDYLPHGPWSWLAKGLTRTSRGLAGVSRAMSTGTRGMGVRGRGCLAVVVAGLPLLLLLVVAPALLAVAPLLWLAVLVLVPVGHVVVAGVRLHRWRQEHARAAREAIEGAMSGR